MHVCEKNGVEGFGMLSQMLIVKQQTVPVMLACLAYGFQAGG